MFCNTVNLFGLFETHCKWIQSYAILSQNEFEEKTSGHSSANKNAYQIERGFMFRGTEVSIISIFL
jgi:hypothetical protein